QAGATTPEPQPQPVPAPQPIRPVPSSVPVPVPVQPAGPVIDPALRQRVDGAIVAANQALTGARNRKAGGSNLQQAVNALAEANQRAATAKTNDDLQAALASANNAKLYADLAMGPGVPPQPLPQPIPKTIGATGDDLAA